MTQCSPLIHTDITYNIIYYCAVMCSSPCPWYPGDLRSPGRGCRCCHRVLSAAASAVQACHSHTPGSPVAPWSPAHSPSHATDIHSECKVTDQRAWGICRNAKCTFSYLVGVLDPALETLRDALQLPLWGLFVGAVGHGLPAQDDGLPPRYCRFTLPQQPLLLLHQQVQSHLHKQTRKA